MIYAWFDWPEEEDVESVQVQLDEIPRIGEDVGYRPLPDAPPGEKLRILDRVVDIRHYFVGANEDTFPDQEIRILLGRRS